MHSVVFYLATHIWHFLNCQRTDSRAVLFGIVLLLFYCGGSEEGFISEFFLACNCILSGINRSFSHCFGEQQSTEISQQVSSLSISQRLWKGFLSTFTEVMFHSICGECSYLLETLKVVRPRQLYLELNLRCFS